MACGVLLTSRCIMPRGEHDTFSVNLGGNGVFVFPRPAARDFVVYRRTVDSLPGRAVTSIRNCPVRTRDGCRQLVQASDGALCGRRTAFRVFSYFLY